jgi:hypothetical protein
MPVIVVTRLRLKDLPDWQTSYQRLVADGQVAQLSAPSPANASKAFPAPVEPS